MTHVQKMNIGNKRKLKNNLLEPDERKNVNTSQAILSIYLRNELLLSESTATVMYHVFTMGCYIVPLVGAICADSFLGRYRTILYFSIIYLSGNILMCIASTPIIAISKMVLTIFGLILIAVGTGGIKPCVAAFGGDQFYLPDQQDDLQHFFAIFYFTINLGGFMGMVLTPILRKFVSCFGDDTCYPLGFGFPAALMIIAILLFMLGKPWYRIKTPKQNIMLQFIQCASYAAGEKIKNKDVKKLHWLDFAEAAYDKKLIKDMKIVFSLLLLFSPLPVFWSLFDQQGSTWTFQASHMNGDVLGLTIVPDQMQVVNPAMVLILIPIFERYINPFLARYRGFSNSLNKMAIGGLWAGLAFVTAGILELQLEKTYPDLPKDKHASMFIINTLPCKLSIYNPFNKIQYMGPSELYSFKNVPAHNLTSYQIMVQAPEVCGNIKFYTQWFQLQFSAIEQQVDTVIIGVSDKNEVEVHITDAIDFKKSLSGKPRIRIAYVKGSNTLNNVTVSLKNVAGLQDVYFIHNEENKLADSTYMELPEGIYECIISNSNQIILDQNNFNLEFGGIYALIIRENHQNIEFIKLYSMSAANTVNILWLIPQYLLISTAEIMFAVAGLEFSFMQAPKSMKTVTIAGWYLYVAIGNLVVIIITHANMFKSQAYIFFLFAALLIADMMLFVEMSSSYYVRQLEADSSIEQFRDATSLQSESDEF